MTRPNDDEIDFTPIHAVVRQIHALSQRAFVEYSPIVEDIIRCDNRDVRKIEQTLDGLLDFCGYDPIVELFRRLCRHYWDIDHVAAASYVQSYREMWDSESDPKTEEST